MRLIRWLRHFRHNRHPRKSGPCRPAALRLESLETRCLPSGNTISGSVYLDANNNGLLDAGESGLANSTVALFDSTNALVASTTTDGSGQYAFNADSRISTAPATLVKQISFPVAGTDWDANQALPQFDPALGTLTAVDITSAAAITSDIKVENTSNQAVTIRATVGGSITLTAPGVPGLVTPLAVDQTFNASAFDTVIDFRGSSGHDFLPQSVAGSNSVTLTAPADLAGYTGTGSVNVAASARGTSTASGGANLVMQVATSASAQVTVVYHYIPSNALRPGNYLIVQTGEPPNTVDGRETAGNVVPLSGGIPDDTIPVTLGNTDLPNNNFGELAPARVAGVVYTDLNNNGQVDPGIGEAGIAGVAVRLTGTDDRGNPVAKNATTDGGGAYRFDNLRPGSYTVTETQPAGYLDGTDTAGAAGGAAGNDIISGIALGQGVNGAGYNFGELPPASLAGFVYRDGNNNGVFEPNLGEAGITRVKVTLTGQDDRGNDLNVAVLTDAGGAYRFGGLRPAGPGGYTVTETQPIAFINGKDTIGSPGGATIKDQFNGITLTAGFNGVNNNFGELPPPPPPPVIIPSPPTVPLPDPTPTAPAPPTVTPKPPSKSLFLASQANNGTTTTTTTTTTTGAGDALLVAPSAGAPAFASTGSIFVTAADAGGGPNVVVYDAATKAVKYNFFAYDPRFTGGVRVAAGDVNGDGTPDIICAAGPGGGPDVRVFDGATGALIREFFAFSPNFTGGVWVAAGDVNADGFTDIICGADKGGGPNITVYSGQDGARLLSFFAFDPGFAGGVRVASGDVNADGFADIVCGAGPGGGPNVTAYSGTDGRMLLSFFAFDPGFSRGLFVGAGDVNGDGHADPIVGAGAGSAPNVGVFDGRDGSVLERLVALDPSFTGGVRVAAADRDGDGKADVIAVAGPGGSPQVRIYQDATSNLIDSFFAYDPAFRGGLFIGGN